MRKLLFLQAFLAFLGGLGGCSWVFVTSPEEAAETPGVTCTDSYLAPIADTGIGAGLLAFGAYFFVITRGKGGMYDPGPIVGGLTAGPALALFLPSALHGYRAVGACDAERQAAQRPVRRLGDVLP